MVSLSAALVKLVHLRHICHIGGKCRRTILFINTVDKTKNKTYIYGMTIKTNTIKLIIIFVAWATVKSWFTGVASLVNSLTCDIGWIIAVVLAIRTFDENTISRNEATKATNNATIESRRANDLHEAALREERAIANRNHVWECRTELRKQMRELFVPILETPVWKDGGLMWIHKPLSSPIEITFHHYFIEQVLTGVSPKNATKSDKVVVFKTWYMRLEDFKYEFEREYPSLSDMYDKLIHDIDTCANISREKRITDFADKQFNQYYEAMRGTVTTANNHQSYTDEQWFERLSRSFNCIRNQYHELLSKMNVLENRHVF